MRAPARDLIKRWFSLWPFVKQDGAEPTHHHAERVVRPSVLLRKINDGTHCNTGADVVSLLQGPIVTAKCNHVRPVDWLTSMFEALWARVPLSMLLRAKGVGPPPFRASEKNAHSCPCAPVEYDRHSPSPWLRTAQIQRLLQRPRAVKHGC